jgi:hypothetical protein
MRQLSPMPVASSADHRRYDNLGQEEWDELVPLCPDHHYEIEKHINKGYPGVTRANAHLDFVRRKSRVSIC